MRKKQLLRRHNHLFHAVEQAVALLLAEVVVQLVPDREVVAVEGRRLCLLDQAIDLDDLAKGHRIDGDELVAQDVGMEKVTDLQGGLDLGDEFADHPAFFFSGDRAGLAGVWTWPDLLDGMGAMIAIIQGNLMLVTPP